MIKKTRSFCVAAALLLAATAAWPQTVSTTPATPAPDATFDCYRGTSIILRDAASLQACVDASKADTLTRKASASYTARTNAGWSTKYTAPVIVPTCGTIAQPTTRTQACPSGTTGSYVQTSTPTPAPYPTCSTVGPWLPASPPAGACTPVVVTPPTTPVAELPAVNTALIPAPGFSSPDRLISNTTRQLYRDRDGMGAFRTVCQYSHMNFDDPLVYPGRPGASHLHVWFGNSLADGNSTPESIRTTGNGTCRGGIVNRTAYWVPALIDTRDGRPIRPDVDHDIYYKTGYKLYGQDAQVVPFPVGFRMIAGDSKSRVPQSSTYFECDGNRVGSGIPNNCGLLTQVVEFPQCWDGVNLDSPDHRSHVVYASGGTCPSTHPAHLPEVSYHIKYRGIPAGAVLRLSSDINGTPAGSSNHGDWVNGWEQDVLNSGIVNIVKRGLSGGSDLVGDGRSIYWP